MKNQSFSYSMQLKYECFSSRAFSGISRGYLKPSKPAVGAGLWRSGMGKEERVEQSLFIKRIYGGFLV